ARISASLAARSSADRSRSSIGRRVITPSESGGSGGARLTSSKRYSAASGLGRAQRESRVRREREQRLDGEDRQARRQSGGRKRRQGARLGSGRPCRTGEHDEDERERPEKRLQAAQRPTAILEVGAERHEGRDGREGDCGEQCVECEPVGTAGIGSGGKRHEQGRKRSTNHWSLASLSCRTVLLCSRRP